MCHRAILSLLALLLIFRAGMRLKRNQISKLQKRDAAARMFFFSFFEILLRLETVSVLLNAQQHNNNMQTEI